MENILSLFLCKYIYILYRNKISILDSGILMENYRIITVPYTSFLVVKKKITMNSEAYMAPKNWAKDSEQVIIVQDGYESE